jgi:hypothetical protein
MVSSLFQRFGRVLLPLTLLGMVLEVGLPLPASAVPLEEPAVSTRGLFDDLLLPEKDVPKSKIGMNAFVNDQRFGSIAEQLREVKETLGIPVVRLLFAWNDQVQPSPDTSPNFSFYDEIARTLPPGTKALVVLTGVPSWMHDPAQWQGGDPRSTFVRRWASRVMRRYRNNRRIVAYQIWNEPNMLENRDNVVLGLAQNPERYVEMLGESRTRIRSFRRRPKIVSAATTAINQNYPATLEYARGMKDAGLEEHCDVVGVHYYGSHLENVLRPDGVEDYIKSLARPVWVTESGQKGIFKQREYVRRFWPFLLENFPNIRLIFYYQFTEDAPPSSTYALKTLIPATPVSDLYIYLRDEAPAR